MGCLSLFHHSDDLFTFLLDADIDSYSILQQIVRGSSADTTEAGSSGSPPSPVEEVVFEVLYTFNTCQSSAPQSPISSNGDGASYSVESSVSICAASMPYNQNSLW